MELGLKNKIAVVTGGSSGIGRASAAMLAAEGATVLILARRRDVLAAATETVAKFGHVESATLDVTDMAAYGKLLKDTAERHGRLDIIVNNAGFSDFDLIENMSDKSWHASFSLNVDAAFASIRAAMPIMREQGSGSIINVTSIMGARAQANAAAYGSAKAALQQLTNIAAVEGAPHNIRLNTIQVGSIQTEATDKYTDAFPELAAQVAKAIPMHRWGQPDEVASAVAFLASERASFITGACLAIDGALGIAFPY